MNNRQKIETVAKSLYPICKKRYAQYMNVALAYGLSKADVIKILKLMIRWYGDGK